MSNIITIPYQFEPRTYQKELLAALDSGYKRAIAVYHRRAQIHPEIHYEKAL